MANTQAPFGLRPIKSEGGETRVNYYPLASTSAIVYEGDVVELSGGKVIKSTGTVAVTSLGVAARDSGALVTGGIARFPVYDDPDQMFAAQATSAATQTSVGLRCGLTQGTLTNFAGFSVQSIDVATQSTSYPVLLLGLIDRPDNESGNYAELIVKLASRTK